MILSEIDASDLSLSYPKLFLAPMQGLVDDVMRHILTRIGRFDGCVTEFVRVTHTVHGRQTWLKYMPELNNLNQTQAGVPVAIQLLGSNIEYMVKNALYIAELGAGHIDLNFGCPAPVVNQHEGGAILLKEPARIERIVYALRENLPSNVFLSAKMRLGYEDKNLALDCAKAIEMGGAQQLTIHARTKIEGYQPPAHWEWIRKIKDEVSIPLIANGDVFSVEDYCQAREISGCKDVMLGRGAVRKPDLARQIALYNCNKPIVALSWGEILAWIQEFFLLCCAKPASQNYPVARLKQWLAMMKSIYPEANTLFDILRTQITVTAIKNILKNQIEMFSN